MHDHAFGTVWRARAAAIPDEVLCTRFEPPTVRVVTIVVRLMRMKASVVSVFTVFQVVTHGHTAGFDDPGCLVLALMRLEGEAFGALSRLLIFIFFLRLLFIIILLFDSLFSRLMHRRSKFFSLNLLILGIRFASRSSTGLLFSCRHCKLLLL